MPCLDLAILFASRPAKVDAVSAALSFFYLHLHLQRIKKKKKEQAAFSTSPRSCCDTLCHLESVSVQIQAFARKMWRRKQRKGNTHTHTHPDGDKSREKNWFTYLIKFSFEIPRCLEVSRPPPTHNAASFRSAFAPIKESESDTNPESKCLFQMRSWPERRCCFDPERVSERRRRRQLRRHAAQRKKRLSPLMVGDVLKAASANYYRRCTSGLQRRFHLSSWQPPALPLNLILVSSAISSPRKAHNFNPSGAPLAAFTITCGFIFWSPPPPGLKEHLI